MAASPWQAGPWIVVPGGLAACGNAACEEGASKHSPAQSCPARLGAAPSGDRNLKGGSGDFAKRLDSCRDAGNVISQEEVQQFVHWLQDSGGDWETVAADSRIEVQRHKDHSLCGGVFVRLSAHLPEVTDIALVANCFLNFADRAKWDGQVDGFRVLSSFEANDVLHYTMHATPLSDRDFVVLHALLRHEEQRGLLIYSRSTDDKFAPPTRAAVRAQQYLLATEITEHPAGGVRYTTISAVDPRIPLLPKWIMNRMVPCEFRKWVDMVDRRCKELRAEGVEPPCAALFRPASSEVAALCPEASPLVEGPPAGAAAAMLPPSPGAGGGKPKSDEEDEDDAEVSTESGEPSQSSSSLPEVEEPERQQPQRGGYSGRQPQDADACLVECEEETSRATTASCRGFFFFCA